MSKLLRLLILVLLCIPKYLVSMTFDNRFVPLLKKPLYHRPFVNNLFDTQLFFMVGDKSWACPGTTPMLEETGLFEIYGPYNQVAIDQSLQLSGRTSASLIRSDLLARETSLPWFLDGRLQVSGAAFEFYRQFSRFWGIGGGISVARINTALEMIFDNSAANLSASDQQELYELNARMLNILGLKPGLWTATTLGDAEFFVRFGAGADYKYKFRRIDGGIKFGLLLPAAQIRSINVPASIPFGGDRHFGFYIDFAAEAELKQDFRIGLDFRFTKRFARTSIQRIPVSREPSAFGALVGPLRVDPGLTFSFSPYVALEDIRAGWGFLGCYTLIVHDEDSFIDKRADQAIPSNLSDIRRRSSWVSEYVTLGLTYDFVKERECACIVPTLLVTWDIPLNITSSKRSAKTHSASVIFKIDF